MVIRIIKGVMGAGVSVETILADPYVYPGGKLRGHVNFTGGDVDQAVKEIALEFNVLVEQEGREDERRETQSFYRLPVSGTFQLPARTSHSVPFEIRTHWETPISAISSRPLIGMRLGVATELALDKARDKGDLDPLTVEPLPVQAEAMRAVEAAGFVLQGARMRQGAITGSELSVHQEIRYWASGDFSSHFKELTVTFVTNSSTTDIILQADNPAGVVNSPDGAVQRFAAQNNVPTDFTEPVRAQLHQLAQKHVARY
ncbi:MAG: sporulation protein [Stackebrandtia sp.]